MARNMVGSIQDMIQKFKSGDILGGLMGVLDLVGQVAGAIAQIKSGGAGGGGGGGWMAGIASIASLFHPSGGGGGTGNAIGMSTGGSFKIGGVGGVDSQMVRFRGTPGEIVDVRRGGDRLGGGTVKVLVQANDYFDAKVQSVAAPMADNAAARGALGGAQMAIRHSIRRERGRLA
jgi:hypothetical protein